ncbi:MAG: hypothetical protein HYS08_04235 [Chlamydiae bacterium]|nr:hypothetical protein [Chlamydiota bacterium]MBI3266126.1 hypothetical protein [Chlamydiota bacterium]
MKFMGWQKIIIQASLILGTVALAHSDTFSIEKVTRQNSQYHDLGRPHNDLGYEISYIDKFYSPQNLPPEEVGESHRIEWKCSQLTQPQTLQLQFEYRLAGDNALHKKMLEVSVDRTGLYETEVEHKGEEFAKEGPVDVWKVTLLKDGKILAQQASNLWVD